MAFGGADVQELIAVLKLKDEFSGSAGKISRSVNQLDKDITRTGNRSYKAGQQIGTGIKNAARIAAGAIGLLTANLVLGIRSLSRLDDVVTQTNAVLKSTKGVAGLTAGAIRDLSNKFESMNATIDDTVIQSGANLLLTFTNIRKNAFEPTLKAALDMNQAFGGGEAGLTNTIRILGKALNDPAKGLTALQRVGVRFTDAQKNQIQIALRAGDVFKAQGIILAELQKRFGGSFLAGGSTTAGKIAKVKDAIDDLQRALAERLLPIIGTVADGLAKFLSDPAVIQGAKDLGDSIAGLFSPGNIKAGADILKGAIGAAREAAPIIAEGAKATFAVVSAAVGLFRSLPPEIQKLAIGAFAINKLTGGLITNVGGAIAGGIAKAILGQFAGNINVSGAVVNVNGGIGGGPPTGGGGGPLGAIVKGAAAVAIVAVAADVAASIAGVKRDSPNRQIDPTTGNISRSVTDLGQRIAHTTDNIQHLQERANGGDTFAAKQLVEQKIVLQQLLGQQQNPPPQKDLFGLGKLLNQLFKTSDTRSERIQIGIAFKQNAAQHEANRLSRQQLQAFRDNKISKSDIAAIPKLLAYYQTSLHPSQKSMATDLAKLTQLQRHYLAVGDTKTAGRLAAAIAQLKTIQNDAARRTSAGLAKVASDTRAEGIGIRQAVQAKKLSVALTIPVTTVVSVRDTVKVTYSTKRYGNIN